MLPTLSSLTLTNTLQTKKCGNFLKYLRILSGDTKKYQQYTLQYVNLCLLESQRLYMSRQHTYQWAALMTVTLISGSVS